MIILENEVINHQIIVIMYWSSMLLQSKLLQKKRKEEDEYLPLVYSPCIFFIGSICFYPKTSYDDSKSEAVKNLKSYDENKRGK